MLAVSFSSKGQLLRSQSTHLGSSVCQFTMAPGPLNRGLGISQGLGDAVGVSRRPLMRSPLLHLVQPGCNTPLGPGPSWAVYSSSHTSATLCEKTNHILWRTMLGLTDPGLCHRAPVNAKDMVNKLKGQTGVTCVGLTDFSSGTWEDLSLGRN